jgi:hypothetical protein
MLRNLTLFETKYAPFDVNRLSDRNDISASFDSGRLQNQNCQPVDYDNLTTLGNLELKS